MSQSTVGVPYEEIYRNLMDRDARLVDISLRDGLDAIVDDARGLASDCAENYGILLMSGQLRHAEDLRSKSRFWASKYRQVTGQLFYPSMPKVDTSLSGERHTLMKASMADFAAKRTHQGTA